MSHPITITLSFLTLVFCTSRLAFCSTISTIAPTTSIVCTNFQLIILTSCSIKTYLGSKSTLYSSQTIYNSIIYFMSVHSIYSTVNPSLSYHVNCQIYLVGCKDDFVSACTKEP